MEKKSTTESTPQVEKSPSGIKQKRKLPEPLFNNSTNVKSSTNDPSLHQGRKRSRPHIDGDWPTHIYIPINFEEKSQEILQKVIKKLAQEDKSNVWHSLIEKNIEVFSLHLSLSRPSFLKTDERDDFINQMRKFIGGVDLFGINFSNFSTLENDNLTRGFLVLEVGTGHSHLNLLVAQINRVLELFFQPKYYENPKFHVSIAWCLLNQKGSQEGSSTSLNSDLISHSFLQTINGMELDFIRNKTWKIDCVNVVIGKNTHQLKLGGLN